MLPRVELVALGASLGAIVAGLLLYGIGMLIDPALAAKRSLRRR